MHKKGRIRYHLKKAEVRSLYEEDGTKEQSNSQLFQKYTKDVYMIKSMIFSKIDFQISVRLSRGFQYLKCTSFHSRKYAVSP